MDDLVYALSKGDPLKYPAVLQLTYGEALHWALLSAKANKLPKKKKRG